MRPDRGSRGVHARARSVPASMAAHTARRPASRSSTATPSSSDSWARSVSSWARPAPSTARRYFNNRATPFARVAANGSSSAGTTTSRRSSRAVSKIHADEPPASSSATRRGHGHAGDLGQRLAEHARVQRVVDELPRDLAARVVGAQPRERADGGADLRENAEVAETFGIDAEAAAALVVAQALFEVGEALERVAHEDPGEVVVEVAPVRELPVGDRDQLGPRVHEVAGTGVALHQHERPVAVGGAVAPQPRERQRDHGNAAAGRSRTGSPTR